MRILMVSLYPPARDGIAAYAVQAVRRLRAEGHDVEVLSPGPSAAHHHLDLVGPRGALALARRVRKYDKVIVQFHPDVFYRHPASWQQRVAESAALALAWRAAREVELRVHEVDYAWGGERVAGFFARRMFRAADRIVVHTDTEAAEFEGAFNMRRGQVEVTAHGADFTRRVDATGDDARRALGLPTDEFMFLAIGFIQPHKGFDRAIRAFAGLQNARLDVVGSVRVEEPDYVRHLEELEQLAAATPGAHLHTGFVTDDEFDRWLVASDAVVLPYRSIWSSSVLERAALYGRPTIITRVGGLAAQAEIHPGVILVDDDAELAVAMRRCAGQPVAAAARGEWNAGAADRDAVMLEIRTRAAVARGAPTAALHSGPVQRRTTDASAPLRRTPPLGRPAAISGRPGAGFLKRLTRRLIDWEINPIVQQVNTLREATIQAIEAEAAAED